MTTTSGYPPMTGLHMNGAGYGMAEFGNDANMVVIFYTASVKDEIASREAGAPMFKNVPYIKMHPAGEHLNIIERPIEERDRQRFPRQYQQFVMNQTQVPDGTP